MDTPLVELQVNKEWYKVTDATVRFTVASTYPRSSWDWIAIYKVIPKRFPFWSFLPCSFSMRPVCTGWIQTSQRLPGVHMGQGRTCLTGKGWNAFMQFELHWNPKFFHVFVWQVTFSEEDLPRDDCEYILGYYSNNLNSIVGLSAPVLVRNRINWTWSRTYMCCAAVCAPPAYFCPQATFSNISDHVT